MDTLRALLDAVRDAPDEDLPRCVLGDWLMEQPDPVDQARGEFIHLQCRLARLAEDDPQREDLQTREKALLQEHRAAWLADLPVVNSSFERGLVHLAVDASFVAQLRLLEKKPTWRWVFSLLVGSIDVGTASWLATWPGVARLGELSLRGGSSGQMEAPGGRLPIARVLARSRYLSQLPNLRLTDYLLSDESLQELVAAPWLCCLARLDLASNSISEVGVSALVRAPLGRVHHLGLANNLLRGAGAAVVAGAAGLANLRSLDLGRNILGPAGARALAATSSLEKLTDLDLRLNGVMSEGARALAGSALAKRLRRLNLVGNGIIEPDAIALLKGLGDVVEM